MKKPDWNFEHALQCQAEKGFAWNFWADVSNWERIEGKAVEWIKLEGSFEKGARGATKMPGQEPQIWEITDLQPEFSATILMKVGEAVFYNTMTFESLAEGKTLITQSFSLEGLVSQELIAGMREFETSAPQGLAKLVEAIEMACKG